MADTKTHPIKTTLNLAIDYITQAHKTEEQKYVFGFNCSPEFASLEFEMTKRDFGFAGKNLAYHLIQSFAPGEVTPEMAHEIGKSCAKNFSAASMNLYLQHTLTAIIFTTISSLIW